MSHSLDPSRVKLMPPDKAQEIARGLKGLAESYAGAGMAREATKADRDSRWWLAYAISLEHTPPRAPG